MLLTYFGISLLSQKALGYARSCSLQLMFQRPSYLDATHVSFASTRWRNQHVPFNPYKSSPWSWACMPSKASKTGKEAWCFLISASELRCATMIHNRMDLANIGIALRDLMSHLCENANSGYVWRTLTKVACTLNVSVLHCYFVNTNMFTPPNHLVLKINYVVPYHNNAIHFPLQIQDKESRLFFLVYVSSARPKWLTCIMNDLGVGFIGDIGVRQNSLRIFSQLWMKRRSLCTHRFDLAKDAFPIWVNYHRPAPGQL